MRIVEFFFDVGSPYSYIAATQLQRLKPLAEPPQPVPHQGGERQGKPPGGKLEPQQVAGLHDQGGKLPVRGLRGRDHAAVRAYGNTPGQMSFIMTSPRPPPPWRNRRRAAGLRYASHQPRAGAPGQGRRAVTDTTTTPTIKPTLKPERPRLHKVILLNDDYTPRDFVVTVLKTEFAMAESQAQQVMLTAHRRGACVVAVFTREIAEAKATKATEAGRRKGYPLMFTTEPEE